MTTSKKALVASNGNQFFGTDGKEDKCLNVRYLEDNIVISIHGLSTDPNSGSKYDYKTGNEIYLKGKVAKSLYRLIRKASEALNAGETVHSKSVSSASNMIKVCDGTSYGLQPAITLVIFNGIDPETKIGDKSALFQFRNDVIVADYNEKTGTYNAEAIDADVDYLLETLKAFVEASSNSFAHYNKKEFKWTMDAMTSRQFQIMEALGIKVETLRSSKVNWNAHSNVTPFTKSVATSSNDLAEQLIAE